MTTLLALTLSCVVAVQNPQTVEPPKPMGKISGVVTRRDTGRPIPDVVIRLVRWEGSFGQQIPAKGTDAQGRFEFDGLAAGSYSMTFLADGFVSLQFGQETPQAGAKRIELKESELFGQADIALPPTTAIEGRLLDEFGDPVPGILVQPALVQYVAGKRRLVPAGGGSRQPRLTDDLGRFRIFNMPPGDYYLIAVAGPFAGANDPSGFAVTYYPGTAAPMEAAPVRLELGSDLSGLVFALKPAATATISGVVTDASGKPLAGSIRFLATSGGDVRSLIMANASVSPNGEFTFRNVAPGTYVIQAYIRAPGGEGNLGSMQFASLEVSVPESGDDVVGLQVKVPPAPAARGRIVFEGDGLRPKRVMVSPSPVNFASAPAGGGPPNTVTREDWTFEVSNMSGVRVIRAIASPGGWTLKQVTLNGRDITDEPVDFSGGDVNGIEITLTNRGSVLTGMVTDGDKPATDATVVFFSSDATKWVFPSRYFGQVRPDPRGRFEMSGLPSGDYLALALPTVQGTDWQDPEFLKKHTGVATHVSLSEGATQSIALKVYRQPR